MKKSMKIIIMIAIIAIVVMVLSIYFKNQKNKNVSTEKIKQETNASVKEQKNESIEELKSENTTKIEQSKDESNFYGYSFNQWKEKIEQFYGNYNGINVTEVICKYNENNDFTATVATEYEVCAEFVFDKKTGIAKDKNTGVEIDFIKGKIVNQIKNKSNIFKDNICLAIGYVEGQKEEEFIDKYYENSTVFNSITKYDFRNELGRQSQFDNKFVIVPENENVKVSIYDCYIDDEGQIKTKNLLSENITEQFTLLFDNYESTTPQICIKFEVNGFEDIIPLTFSGYDGHLELEGHETEVRDISIYN